MRSRTGFNPKRRIAPANLLTEEQREDLAQRVTYGGNPEHKRSPGDYGLEPPASPRPGKTLCDAVRPMTKTEATDLLRRGLRKGMISSCAPGNWPQNIWAVADSGEPFEAQLENAQRGVYHGYPLPERDDFRRVVTREWVNRDQPADG